MRPFLSAYLTQSALEQLLVTLTHQQAVLVAKQRQLESATLDSCSGATRGKGVPRYWLANISSASVEALVTIVMVSGGQLSSCVDNSEEQR